MDKEDAKRIVDELNWKYDVDFGELIKLKDFINIIDDLGMLEE